VFGARPVQTARARGPPWEGMGGVSLGRAGGRRGRGEGGKAQKGAKREGTEQCSHG